MQAFFISGIRKSYGNDFDKDNYLRDTQFTQNGKESDMLTLERKDGQTIIIQHETQELRIKVRHAKGDKIKLDFDGSADFVIL